MDDMTPQPKKSFLVALRGVINDYTHNKQTQSEKPKNGGVPQKGQETLHTKVKDQQQVKKTWPPQTVKK